MAATTFGVNSDTSISATSPVGAVGAVDVTVTTPGGTSAVNAPADQFTYTAPPLPTVTAVSPTSGLTTGGSPVTITGTNLTGATAVMFGALAATGLSNNTSSSLTAVSPAEVAGPVDVTVTTPGGTSALNAPADQFTYTAPPLPTVTAVSPTSGLTTGGSPVTITGTDLTGATAVMFGTVAATGLSNNTSSSLTAVAPAQVAGPVDVTVTTPGGTSALNAPADQFTYSTPPVPTVTAVSPSSGPTSGGTQVTITGTNLSGATAVKFGTVAATGLSNNTSSSITAVSPAEVAGPVDVTVTTPGGTSAVNAPADQFSYSAGAGVAIPSPVAGGWQLNGSASVVSSASPPNLQLTSATGFQAGSAFWPTAVPGVGITAAFDISIGGGTGADGETFTLADASVTSPAALGGHGGSLGYGGIKGLAIGFDTYKNAVNPSNNFVGIATGAGTATGTLNWAVTSTAVPALRNTVHHVVVTTTSSGVTVALDGTQVLSYTTALPASVLMGFTGGTGGETDVHAVQNVSITALPPPPPAVTGVSPASGSTLGGTLVTVTGTNLSGATAVKFGSLAATNVTVNSATTVTATTPGEVVGPVDVSVTTPGGTSPVNAPADQFTFTPPPLPTVTGVSPTGGPTTGGTPVTITGTNFTGATAVQFGPTPATTFAVTSATSIAATVPVELVGPVDVLVTTPGGTSAAGPADVFTFFTLTAQATYRGDLGRSGYYGSETGLTTANAATLKLHWIDSGGVGAFAQPIAANNMVYWADWTGNEHGTALTGTDDWTTNLGTTTPPASNGCVPPTAGPTSTPVAAVVNGTPMLFVAGGNAIFYALNALTGAIVWQTQLGVSPSAFLWDSPALYNGILYVGISSYGDCPLVQGKLFAMDVSTGTVLHTANMVPTGCMGGGIWGSPAIDTSDGSIWVTTGSPPSCGLGGYAPSIVKLRASDLTVLGSWTVPAADQAAGDPDFGSTPTLFSATINGQNQLLVGASDKDGFFYAWSWRTPNAQGQLQVVWQTQVGTARLGPRPRAPSSRPRGTGRRSTSVEVTSPSTEPRARAALDALNPATGAYIWQDCLANHIEGGITEVPGLLVLGDLGVNVRVIATSNGSTLFDYHTGVPSAGKCAVSNGVIYVPATNGTLIALGQ